MQDRTKQFNLKFKSKWKLNVQFIQAINYACLVLDRYLQKI